MLHIILIILKIIGIILALLFLLFLLILFLILFVPLRYRIQAEKNGDQICAGGKVSWLLHIISLVVEYRDGNLTLKLRIFGIPKLLQSPDKKEKKSVKADIPKPNTKIQERVLEHKSKKVTKEPEPVPVIEDRILEGKWNPFWHKCKSFWERIKGIWNKIVSLPKKIQKVWHNILQTRLKIENLWNLFKNEGIKLLNTYKRYLLYLWKHLRPRKIAGSLHYGFEDPSVTGQFTGVLYILLPAKCNKVLIKPDFGQAVLEGELLLKGYIRCIHLLRIGWKVFRDKDLRQFIAQLKA